jgi:hypothetical protein
MNPQELERIVPGKINVAMASLEACAVSPATAHYTTSSRAPWRTVHTITTLLMRRCPHRQERGDRDSSDWNYVRWRLTSVRREDKGKEIKIQEIQKDSKIATSYKLRLIFYSP